MIEIEYTIAELKTSMFVVEDHHFYLIAEKWIKADDINVGDEILACSGSVAKIVQIKKIDATRHYCDLKSSHNHHYFVTTAPALANDTLCDRAPIDPLELVSYQLANKPSNFPDGTPTGDHSGPWVAARYVSSDASQDVIGWGRASDNMCAEDAAVSDLRHKLDDASGLHRGNVEISHAYIRKYTRKGRFVNKMSPCIHCRDNYGSALNDRTLGKSNLHKKGRDYLPPRPTDK
ncbi:hypothetical protein JK628_15540 [Shewanella sp. KX20019]|uniref:polymorphic toxin-type HINT domain-containing protein n=1 Tax=Shewanella sp. KX20019 TaxID=2803864 RepID=UPI0019263514|nr:polymorphic toxin-type HINT domain-containing protein [Shewanella sp. KX20019]QQX78967.1 hypothetical protein JK628_15540 [Shewanella sp. KX20019]